MAKKKKDTEYIDAKGDLHKQFADGSCEIYIGGFDKDEQYVEITDEADESVRRKRFMPYIAPPIQETLQNTDAPEVATRDLSNDAQAAAKDADGLFEEIDKGFEGPSRTSIDPDYGDEN